jgi:hypothetical protein
MCSSTTNNGNIAIGQEAGYNITGGRNNLLLGNSATAGTSTTCNEITIGTTAYTNQRAPSSTWNALSDARDKTNVENMPVGLEFLREVRPVKFTWAIRNTDETHPRYNMPDSGFIAQELLATADKYNANSWLKVASNSNPDEIYADPGRLLPVTIKAVQELTDQIDALTVKVQVLEEKIQQLGG